MLALETVSCLETFLRQFCVLVLVLRSVFLVITARLIKKIDSVGNLLFETFV